ncbi:MAG: DUF433 domain-containing protein [bacterium]|nr:DUF433 domain-containing protein [bacterium]
MNKESIQERIEINPTLLSGKPVVRGTRIPVSLVLNLLGNGYTTQRIVDAYPELVFEDIVAALRFAERLTNYEEEVVVPGFSAV